MKRIFLVTGFKIKNNSYKSNPGFFIYIQILYIFGMINIRKKDLNEKSYFFFKLTIHS